METETKEFLVLLLVMGVLDYIYLGIVRKKYVARKIAEMNSKSEIAHPPLTFVIAYMLMATGLYHFVMKRRRMKTTAELVANAAYFGLVVYGVFDMSMMNLVEKWTAVDAIQDIAWGASMFALSVYITILITG